MKRIKLIVLAVVSGVSCWYLPWQAVGESTPQQEDRSRFEIVGQDTPTNDRFGADDGAALVVHFTGDIHGSLEPCG